MKKIITILILTLTYAGLLAQAPQKISYQAVVRNATGTLVALKPVGVRISILQGSEFGAAIFVETHTPTTNVNALLSISIGGGAPVLGTFTGINWNSGPYFLKSEMDPLGGTSYSIIGTQQLMSVPYALYTYRAKVADSIGSFATITPYQISAGGASDNQILRWDGFNWKPSDETTYKAGRGIGINNGTITTQWKTGLYGPYIDSTSLGIGTSVPYSKVHVSGSGSNLITTNFEGQGWNSFYRYNRYLGYLGSWSDSNALDFGGTSSGTNTNIVTDATPRISVMSGSGYVGVNTTAPTNTLDVNGGITTQALKITTGAANGRVLTSDASGNASWGAVPGKQLVGVYPLNGFCGGPYVSQTAYSFVGLSTTITVTSSGDIITGNFQVPLATSAGVATNVRFGLGYQLGAGTITNFTGGLYSVISVGTERHSQSATASVTGLAPGTYTVGVVIMNGSAVSINTNDYQNGYFMLIR